MLNGSPNFSKVIMIIIHNYNLRKLLNQNYLEYILR